MFLGAAVGHYGDVRKPRVSASRAVWKAGEVAAAAVWAARAALEAEVLLVRTSPGIPSHHLLELAWSGLVCASYVFLRGMVCHAKRGRGASQSESAAVCLVSRAHSPQTSQGPRSRRRLRRGLSHIAALPAAVAACRRAGAAPGRWIWRAAPGRWIWRGCGTRPFTMNFT